MGCQVQSGLWLTNLLGERGAEREGKSHRLGPSQPRRHQRCRSGQRRCVSRILGPAVSWNLGTVDLRDCRGSWAIASRAVIGGQRRGEGLGHGLQIRQVNPVPVVGVRRAARGACGGSWFGAGGRVPCVRTGRSFRQGLNSGGPLGSRRWVAFPVCYLGKVCILASQSPRRTWYMASRFQPGRREPDVSTSYGGLHPVVGLCPHVVADKKDGRGSVSQLLAGNSRSEHSQREPLASRPSSGGLDGSRGLI